jgi:hypothetical protein
MRRAAQFAARLVIAFGVLLNGLNPAMAGTAGSRGGSTIAHMTMMPGMDMGSSRSAPAKEMPCGGMDCGCCIGGACAMPAATETGQVIFPAWSSGKTSHNAAFLNGITFPPDVRPPISRAIAA